MYQVLNVGAGREEPDGAFMKNATSYLKLQFALTYLYWSCLWAVKACFLSFYHRLTKNLRYCRQAWWATVIITLLSYIGAIITYVDYVPSLNCKITMLMVESTDIPFPVRPSY